MKTLKINSYRSPSPVSAKVDGLKNYLPILLLGLLILLWPLAEHLVTKGDPTVGLSPTIWLLFLLSSIIFMVTIGLCWWLLQKFWMSLGLPGLGNMVSQFKELSKWEQLRFYWASFALLLLAAVGVLTAIL